MAEPAADTDGFTTRALVRDRFEALRGLDEMKTVSWDIPRDELTDREENRVDTINMKIGDLHDIVLERKLEEERDVA